MRSIRHVVILCQSLVVKLDFVWKCVSGEVAMLLSMVCFLSFFQFLVVFFLKSPL